MIRTSSIPTIIRLLLTTLAVLTSIVIRAQDDVPERIDLTNFPGEIVDKVVVPIPVEIF